MSVAQDYLEHALEKEQQQLAWELWRSIYPEMLIGFLAYMPFEQFREQLFQPRAQTTDKTAEEIEAEMLQVIAAHEGR